MSTSASDEQFLRQVVDAAPIALLMVDGEGKVALLNSATERLFGYAPDQLLGRHADELVPEGFPGHDDSHSLGSGRHLKGRRADGSEVPVEIGVNPLETDEGTFVLAAVIDVTDRLGAETTPDEIDDRITIAAALRRTLDQGGLSVVYQPQVDLSSGVVVGMEALARWNSPELGPIDPDRFIPVAENGGMIEPLGEWVLRRACLDAVAIQAVLGRPLDLAVNVSPRQFHAADWLTVVDDILTETGFDPTLARARDHRGHPDGRAEGRGRSAPGVPGERHQDRGRRLRHRLLEPVVPDPFPDRQDQDRPLVRPGAQPRRRRPSSTRSS